MNRIMDIPGFKGVIPSKMEQLEERVILHVSMPKIERIYAQIVIRKRYVFTIIVYKKLNT